MTYQPDPDEPICSSGKRPFRTEERAKGELARSVNRRARDSGYRPGKTEKRVYQCPACEWWHLTSKRRGRG